MTGRAVDALRLIVAFPLFVGGLLYRAVAINGEPLTSELVRETTQFALIFAAALFVLGRVVAAFNTHFPRRED